MQQRALTLAFMTNLYPPYVIGGNEIFTQNIVEALRQRGHTVHVLTGQGKRFATDGYTHQVLNLDLEYKDEIFLGGLPLTTQRLLQWHLFSPSAYWRVQRTLQSIQPDLVIAANLFMASAAPLIAARRQPCPLIVQPMDKWLVYQLRDIGMVIPASTRRHKAAVSLIKYAIQPLLHRLGAPDYLLPVSEFIRRFHLAAGYSADHSRAIYLGIPTERFPYHQHSHPAQRPWRLLFAGQLWEGKGPQVAIEAVSRLRNHSALPPVELMICGTGTPQFVNHLRELIERYGLAPQVQLRGLLPRDQLADEFRTHDLFVFCSIWDEPFSIVLQEALASGIPTIATTSGGTPEGMLNEKTGLLIPPNDVEALAAAIARLMDNAALYERIGEQAAHYVRDHFTFEGFIDRLEQTYLTIVAHHRQGQPVVLTE